MRRGAAVAPGPGVVALGAAGPVAERRVCSVLFCDVVRFTPLSESRDPEAVRELLSAYFGTARTVIGGQPLLDRATDLSPAESRIRAPIVTEPGSEESTAVRHG